MNYITNFTFPSIFSPTISHRNVPRTGNALAEMGLVVARLDKLSRNDDLQEETPAD
ncbi:MAG UNVERIFIED_CONTAM: hypothetical protein LVR29_19685 [Microcystis novacekii LVE1205-3]|jgi:hypothetical protein